MDNIYSEIVEPEKKAGFFQVVEVLYSPKRTFQRVMNAGHAWIFPFIFFSIILVIVFMAQLPEMDLQSTSIVPLGLSEENVATFITVFAIIFSVIIAPLVVLIGFYLVPSLINMFFENFVLGGNARLRQVMNITAYATVPMAIQMLLSSAIIFATGFTDFSFTPQVFMPKSMQTTFLGMWLSILGLFTIWSIILTITGLAELYHHRAAKTAAWLIPFYLAVSTLIIFLISLIDRISSNLPMLQ